MEATEALRHLHMVGDTAVRRRLVDPLVGVTVVEVEGMGEGEDMAAAVP